MSSATLGKVSTSRYKVYIQAMIVLSLFMIYNLTGNMVIFLGAMGLFAFFSIFEECTDAFIFLMICAPSVMMIKLIGNDSALYGYVLLLFEIKYLIKRKKIAIPYVLLLLFAFLAMSIIVSREMSLVTMSIRCIVFFLFLNIFFKDAIYSSYTFKTDVISGYLFGIMANVVLGVLFYLSKGENLLSGYFAGIRNDRNYFSAMLAGGISLSILMIYLTPNRRGIFI